MIDSLQFPSQDSIIEYLEKHDLTKEPYLKEIGIIQAVAKFFADKAKASSGVDLGVKLTLIDLNKRLKLPTPALIAIQINLIQALKECANENANKVVTGG